jgi:hypothetical protein
VADRQTAFRQRARRRLRSLPLLAFAQNQVWCASSSPWTATGQGLSSIAITLAACHSALGL